MLADWGYQASSRSAADGTKWGEGCACTCTTSTIHSVWKGKCISIYISYLTCEREGEPSPLFTEG